MRGLQIGEGFRDYKSGQERFQIGAKRFQIGAEITNGVREITNRGRDYKSVWSKIGVCIARSFCL